MRGWSYKESFSQIWFVLELCENGSLHRVIQQDSDFRVGKARRIAMMIQAAKAVRLLHYGFPQLDGSNPDATIWIRDDSCVHGDIKGDNFLVTGSSRVKLSDFGSALRRRRSDVHRSATGSLTKVRLRNGGTYEYAAPETFDHSD